MEKNEKLVLSVTRAGELIGISRAHAYLMVKRGLLPCVRLGRRIVIPKSALSKLLDNAGTKETS